MTALNAPSLFHVPPVLHPPLLFVNRHISKPSVNLLPIVMFSTICVTRR